MLYSEYSLVVHKSVTGKNKTKNKKRVLIKKDETKQG